MGKPMNLKFQQRWVEYWALFLLVLGFLFAFSIDTMWFAYPVAFGMGAFLGRLTWRWRKNLKGSGITIVLGFLIGFLLGVQHADRKIIVALFVLGVAVSFYVHERGYIRGTEY